MTRDVQTRWSRGNALGLYYGGFRFESRPGRRRFVLVFFSPSEQIPGLVPLLGHDHLRLNIFQFIGHLSSYRRTLYGLDTKKASINNKLKNEPLGDVLGEGWCPVWASRGSGQRRVVKWLVSGPQDSPKNPVGTGFPKQSFIQMLTKYIVV
jgi:hypothetical protein